MNKRSFSSRLMYAMLVVTLLTVISVSSASAAPPQNDDFDNAMVIPNFGFIDISETDDATTAFDDPYCYGQGPTVWYSFTPSESLRIEANTFASGYDTTLSVYTGSRGALTQISCNDDAGGLQSQVIFEATAGETYYFMVGSYGSGMGGYLRFTINIAPEPFEFDLTIDKDGSVIPSKGVATVRGKVFCSQPANVHLYGDLRRKIGRVFVNGSFYSSFVCDGETDWSAVVIGTNGPFVGGKAEAAAYAFTYVGYENYFDEAHRTIRLKGSPPPKPYYSALVESPTASGTVLTFGLLGLGLFAGLVLVISPQGGWRKKSE